MRKRVWIPAALLAAAALGFFGVAPGYLEARMNKVDGKPGIAVSAEAKALHATLQIVDLHSDTLMWQRSLLERGRAAATRTCRGSSRAMSRCNCSPRTTKSPRGQNYDGNSGDTDNITPLVIAQLQPVRTWTSLLERSLWHATKLDRAVARSGGKLVKVQDPRRD